MNRPRGFEKILSTLKHYTYPPVVVIETINKCNLNCIMCPQNKLTRPIGEMNTGLYKKIIDDIANHSPELTQVWLAIMGEVLLMKEKAIEFISYATRKGLTDVNLNTNLAIADEKICEALVRTGLKNIIVGIDACTEDTYKIVRPGGSLRRVMESIDTIIDVKKRLNMTIPSLTLQFIEQDENRHELDNFIDTFKNKKVNLKIRKRLGWGTGVEAPDLNLSDESRDFPCPWLNRTMSIHVTGQVAQCDAAWDGQYYHGDINFQSIAEVWNGRLAKIRDKHWKSDFDFEPCRSCKDWQCGLSEWIHDNGE